MSDFANYIAQMRDSMIQPRHVRKTVKPAV